MSYDLFLILFHQSLSFFLITMSLCFSVLILFSKNAVTAPLLTLYFVYVFVFGIADISYFLYYFIFLRFDSVIYNAKIFYLLGISPFILTVLSSVVEIFLCIDRCLSICFPFKYFKSRQLWFTAFSTFCIFCVIITFVIIFKPYFPETDVTNCRTFGCFLQSTASMFTYIKGALVFLNLFISFIFALSLRKFIHTMTPAMRRINRITYIMISATTLIEFIPLLIGQIFYATTGKQLTIYIGPYGSTISLITITLSSGIYYKAFQKTAQKLTPTIMLTTIL